MLYELYFKSYRQSLQASDYIKWAQDHLYLDDPVTKKLAAMPQDSNFFEVHEVFEKMRNIHQFKEPTVLECAMHHITQLHAELLLPNSNAISLVDELYAVSVEFDLVNEQMAWQGLSDAIDDVRHGDNLEGVTEQELHMLIRKQAREMWHTQKSVHDVDRLVGQKVTAFDAEAGIVLRLENGAITIECPWRVRSAEQILVGETDIRSNQQVIRSFEELVVGKTIQDIQLFENCPFVIIQLDDLFLDIFHASAFFDGWTMTDEEDFYLFSMHGGQIG